METRRDISRRRESYYSVDQVKGPVLNLLKVTRMGRHLEKTESHNCRNVAIITTKLETYKYYAWIKKRGKIKPMYQQHFKTDNPLKRFHVFQSNSKNQDGFLNDYHLPFIQSKISPIIYVKPYQEGGYNLYKKKFSRVSFTMASKILGYQPCSSLQKNHFRLSISLVSIQAYTYDLRGKICIFKITSFSMP